MKTLGWDFPYELNMFLSEVHPIKYNQHTVIFHLQRLKLFKTFKLVLVEIQKRVGWEVPFVPLEGRRKEASGCYYFGSLRCCHLNLMEVARTYSFCRNFRSLKMWVGSSVIILLDRSLLVTVKIQSNYIGNKWHDYSSQVSSSHLT